MAERCEDDSAEVFARLVAHGTEITRAALFEKVGHIGKVLPRRLGCWLAGWLLQLASNTAPPPRLVALHLKHVTHSELTTVLSPSFACRLEP